MAAHLKGDFKVKSIHRTVLMMRRAPEQITDGSCGDTPALVGIDQFRLKLGTLTTIEDARNTADTEYSVSPVAKIAV